MRPTIMALAITSGLLDAFNAVYTRRRGCSGMRLMRLWDKAYQCERAGLRRHTTIHFQCRLSGQASLWWTMALGEPLWQYP